MKNWKKLLFVAIAALPAGLLHGSCNSNCCDTTNTTNCNSNSCCGTDLTADCAGGHIQNKSVYVDIGVGASGTYLHENFFRNNRMTMAEDGWNGAFQAAFFGGRTSDSGSNGLGRRFGVNSKRCMKAASAEDTINDVTQNISLDSTNFNVRTQNDTFQSTICFCPKQTMAGVLLSWKQGFSCRDDDSVRWWFEINAPVVHTKHDMNLKEDVTNPGGGVANIDGVPLTGLDNSPVVANMKDAFKQKNWKYGKIDGCQDQTELANLELKLGYNFINGDCCQLGSYIGFAAKTTACRSAAYVFEPVVGQEHWAFMWGSTFDLPICDWENSSLAAHFAMDSRWWFERSERRSFDLVGKPWSRYQEMYASLAQAREATNELSGTSGINLMTRDVCVTPGYQINGNMAISYTGCRFSAEAGHTFYARMAEKICPNWTVGPVIKADEGNGFVNRFRTIKDRVNCANQEVSDVNEDVYNQNVIQKCDVDWNSGAHEGILAHTFYGALAYNFDDWCYPSFISIGGAYDLDFEDEGTSTMRRWTVFGKIGVSF